MVALTAPCCRFNRKTSLLHLWCDETTRRRRLWLMGRLVPAVRLKPGTNDLTRWLMTGPWQVAGPELETNQITATPHRYPNPYAPTRIWQQAGDPGDVHAATGYQARDAFDRRWHRQSSLSFLTPFFPGFLFLQLPSADHGLLPLEACAKGGS